MSCATCREMVPPGHGLARLAFGPELPGQVCIVGDGTEIVTGERYVVATPDGERLGRAVRYGTPLLPSFADRPVGTVIRVATQAEREHGEQLSGVARDALNFCRERATQLGLPIRPVAALAPLDRDVLVLCFAAEERVDFRELLRELGRRTRRRVELRQVGVRDQAKMAGGWGPCGRTLCCATFMSRFNSVTIRMAKAQHLSLSPSRISGMCGRLMCCLAHEASETGAKSRQGDR